MTYLEHVTTYFISLVGRGTFLSSRDVELVNRWEASKLPVGDVCAAICSAYESARRPPRFSLADCEREVERLRPTSNAVTGGEPRDLWTPSLLVEKLTTLGQEAEEGPAKAAYRSLYRYLLQLPEHELSSDEVSRLDGLAVSYLEAELPKSTVSRARSTARTRARKVVSSAASRETREALASALLERHYCEKYELVVPSTLLFEVSES